MNSLIDSMLSQLQGAPTNQISQQLGIAPAMAQKAIAAALPLIVSALGNNVKQSGGAGALLLSLLQQGQAAGGQKQGGAAGGLGGMLGSVLGSLSGGQKAQGGGSGLGGLLGAVLGSGAQSNNAGALLGQLFGGAQKQAQDGLGQTTGLGAEKAGQLLQMLAPMALSHIAKYAQTNNLDAGKLSAALGQEKSAAQK